MKYTLYFNVESSEISSVLGLLIKAGISEILVRSETETNEANEADEQVIVHEEKDSLSEIIESVTKEDHRIKQEENKEESYPVGRKHTKGYSSAYKNMGSVFIEALRYLGGIAPYHKLREYFSDCGYAPDSMNPPLSVFAKAGIIIRFERIVNTKQVKYVKFSESGKAITTKDAFFLMQEYTRKKEATRTKRRYFTPIEETEEFQLPNNNLILPAKVLMFLQQQSIISIKGLRNTFERSGYAKLSLHASLQPLLRKGYVEVVDGLIGVTEHGKTITDFREITYDRKA